MMLDCSGTPLAWASRRLLVRTFQASGPSYLPEGLSRTILGLYRVIHLPDFSAQHLQPMPEPMEEASRVMPCDSLTVCFCC